MRNILLGVGLLVASSLLAPPSAHAYEVEASFSGAVRLRVGIELSEHAHFTVGAYGGLYRGGYGGSSRTGYANVLSDFGAGGELGLKFYLRDPVEGAIVPHLRLLGSYGTARRRHNIDVEWGRAFTAEAGLGLTYFPRAVIGVGVEAMVGYGEVRYPTSRIGSGGLGVSLLVTFRPGARSPARVVSNVPPPPPPSYDDFSSESAGSAADFSSESAGSAADFPARTTATPRASESAAETTTTVAQASTETSTRTPAPTPEPTEASTVDVTDTLSAPNVPPTSNAETRATSAEALASPMR
jgi:hypothetical protein